MMIDASPFSVNFLRGVVYHDQEFLGRIPIKGPLEHFRHCRALLLQCQQGGISKDLEKQAQRLSRYPFSESYQPSIVALALIYRVLGKNHPPVVPMLLPSGAPLAMKEDVRRDDCLLPLPIAWQLSQIWSELGSLEDEIHLIEKAHLVKRWVEKFGDLAKLLFYREESFSAQEVENFFLTNERSNAVDLDLGMATFSSREIEACLSFSGWNSGLGTMRFGNISSCSFGPQRAPLSDTTGFGVSQALGGGTVIITEKERVEIEGWTRCHGRKESWLHLRASLADHAVQLDTRFVEGDSDSPLNMVFYVQAGKCSPESSGESFLPGSLHRYKGKCDAVILDERVRLTCSGTDQELQIIPLAGEGCFWNANFLIAFSCPSNSPVSFIFSL
jgi:hypothetical protein